MPPQIHKGLNSRNAVLPHAEQTAHDRIPLPGHDQPVELGTAAPCSDRPSIQQVIHRDSSKVLNAPGSLNEIQTACVGLSPEYNSDASNQLHSPSHLPSPNPRSLPEKQTIPSILHLLRETDRWKNPHFVSGSNGGWATVNSR